MILVIFLIIFAVFLILLVVPFGLWVSYRDNRLKVVLSFLIFNFNLNKKSGCYQYQKKKSKFNEKISQKAKKIFRIIKKTVGLLEFICKSLGIIFNNIKIKRIYVFAKVSAEDAHKCAIQYSFITSFSEFLVSSLDFQNRVNDSKIAIYPCFLSEKTNVRFDILVKFNLAKIIICLLKIVFLYAKMNREVLRE